LEQHLIYSVSIRSALIALGKACADSSKFYQFGFINRSICLSAAMRVSFSSKNASVAIDAFPIFVVEIKTEIWRRKNLLKRKKRTPFLYQSSFFSSVVELERVELSSCKKTE